MSKRFFSVALLGAASIALAACSDTSTSPQIESSRPLSGPKLTVAHTAVFVFALNPTIDNILQTVEGHRLVIPANSICKVGVSGYGPSFWDQACAPQTLPVVFTVKTSRDANGAPRVDVLPDVRFSPSKTVSLTFRDAAAANTFGALIGYCPTGASKCIDESATDPALQTVTNPTTGQVSRRIKHFSGYNIILGIGGGCEDGCEMSRVGVRAAAGASGYITTTGFTGTSDDAGTSATEYNR